MIRILFSRLIIPMIYYHAINVYTMHFALRTSKRCEQKGPCHLTNESCDWKLLRNEGNKQTGKEAKCEKSEPNFRLTRVSARQAFKNNLFIIVKTTTCLPLGWISSGRQLNGDIFKRFIFLLCGITRLRIYNRHYLWQLTDNYRLYYLW